jgi:hypothetical protein
MGEEGLVAKKSALKGGGGEPRAGSPVPDGFNKSKMNRSGGDQGFKKTYIQNTTQGQKAT